MTHAIDFVFVGPYYGEYCVAGLALIIQTYMSGLI